MSIVIGVGQHSMAIQNGEVEIANFRQYRIYQEGNRTPITGFDDLPKNLKLALSNGVVEIIITPSNSSEATVDESIMLKNYVPQGYELIDTQAASKVIAVARCLPSVPEVSAANSGALLDLAV